MTNKELQNKVVTIILDSSEEERNAIIDELSGSDAREMLKMVFRTVRGEYAVDFKRHNERGVEGGLIYGSAEEAGL